MTDSLATQNPDARSEGWTPVPGAEFRRLYRAAQLDACARALAPAIAERPALLRAIVQGDATVLWCVGGLSPRDQVIDAVAPIQDGGGAYAAVVRDALPRAEPMLTPVAPHVANRSDINRFVRASDVILAVGCSRSAAYRHLREAAGRPNGTGKALRVTVDAWERYARRTFGR